MTVSEKTAKKIILASTSPIRKKILSGAGILFEARTGSVDEGVIKAKYLAQNPPPHEIALALAMAKALAVSRAEHELIIGADQILFMGGDVLDKPKTITDLRERLLSMRGRSHQLIGAQVCISSEARPWVHISTSTLHVRNFSDVWLDEYLRREGEGVLYCVGGYKFEGLGVQLFEKIEGDYYAILGLELLPLMAHLREIGALQA